MHHTLSRNEYKELLSVEHLKLRRFEDAFSHIEEFFEDSKTWDRKISGLNLLLSIIIEQYQKENIDVKLVIAYVYELNECQNFEIQEGSLHFLESLFKNDYNPEIDIEEDLIIAQNRIYGGR
jgi:hypothetical protein